ncbi:hypothetical protein T190115A13A_80228 [Tenacibaculum sp. 190524A02b]|uniref:Uncharacterized protein n=1 Tax=Tenacibaculum vairaonense TaxID=3137860 RepID=A0ABM9PS50_9FLAO
MKLSKKNIQEWKLELSKQALEIGFRSFEDTHSDEQWIKDYENWTPEDVLREECFLL